MTSESRKRSVLGTSPLLSSSVVTASAGNTQVRDARGRIEYIDALRGVAALMVVVHHALVRVAPAYEEWTLEWFDPGRVGVVAFFLVSGYVVGMTLSSQTPRVFAVRRFWRLFPVYWLTTLLYIAVALITGYAPIEASVVVLLVNISMLQGFLGLASVLPVAWTLGIEIAFYAQSVVTRFARLLDRGVWLGLLWLAVLAVYAAANVTGVWDREGSMPLMMFTASVGLALYLWERGRSRALIALLPSAVIVAPMLGVLLKMNSGDDRGHVSFSLSYLAGLALFGVFYAARSRAFPAWMLKMGAASYALYLIHPVVILASFGSIGMPAVFLLVTVGLSLVGAEVLHRYVEKPTIEIGRRATRGSSTGRMPVPASRQESAASRE